MPLTYASYLKLNELLSLQQQRSEGPEHDEMLFIIIHQVYELWFKEMLHELDHLKDLLAADRVPGALHTLKRCLTIMKTLVGQIDILETMTPLEFLTFRDRLESASGFQSFQFRELEFALGLKRRAVLSRFPEGTAIRRRLEDRFAAGSLWDAFLAFLARNGCPVPAEELCRDVREPVNPSPEIQAVLIELYRGRPALAPVCERLLDLDEGIQEWRYRHVKMVERTIGGKEGTGGSPGAAYLKKTLFNPAFPDLWAIRDRL